jgi:hypothetical protein
LVNANKDKEASAKDKDEFKRKTSATLKKNDDLIADLISQLDEANRKNKSLQAKVDGLFFFLFAIF